MSAADHYKATLLDSIRQAAAPHGLNLIAAVPADRYDAIAPPSMRACTLSANAQSIVVYWQWRRSVLECL